MKLKIPYTQVFVHFISLKEIYPIYKIFFKHILLLTNSILYSIPSLDQKYFENYQDLQNIFQKNYFCPIAVDRVVDRFCFRSERSTYRSTALLTVWVRACVHVSRSTGRSTGPHIGRPTFSRLKAPMFLFVTVDRAVDGGLATVKIFENPVDRRSTVSLISALTASLLNTF